MDGMVFVPGKTIALAPGWIPQLFCGQAARALRPEGREILSLSDAEVLDGWRVSENPHVEAQDQPKKQQTKYDPRIHWAYRQVHIGQLRFHPETKHWTPPKVEQKNCVQPGDVVVTKLPPVRSAWASQQIPRHPVDGNCLLVRGLPATNALWLSICLNQTPYQELLLLQGGTGTMPRVNIGALQTLRLPEPPLEMETLALQWRELLDQELDNNAALLRTRQEAASLIWEEYEERPLEKRTLFRANAAYLSVDNLLPWAVMLSTEQAYLHRAGWPLLSSLVTPLHDRTRMAEMSEGDKVVRLSDIGSELMVPGELSKVSPQQMFHTFAAPILAGEVLLSTLVSSPSCAYIEGTLPNKSYPSDHWVRLRFRETPGAWALILSTPFIQDQMRKMAIGSVQQFTTPQAILSMHLPPVDKETRERWHRVIQRHHEQKRKLEERRSTLWEESVRLFDKEHPIKEKHHDPEPC
jgi:hypothetical protein